MLRISCIVLAAVACCLAQDGQPTPTTPAPTLPELETTAQASYMHGDYEAAHQTLLQAWDLAQQLAPEDPLRYDVLKRLAGVRAAAGEFVDADNYLQQAISWRETTFGPDDPRIPGDLLLSVGYARGRGDSEQAMQIMNRVVRLHIAANIRSGAAPVDALNCLPVADDFSRIAQIQMEMKKLDDAVGTLNQALAIRTKLLGPLDPSLVYDLDRLGGIQITQRAYAQAEATYRHALVIRETLYGKKNADLIATVDGLAYSLFGQKKYDEAEPVYQRLLDLWISSVGDEKHPMVAITLEKIAVFYSAQKKWDECREAITRANAIRAYLLADGLSNEASLRIDEGKLEEAIAPYQRAVNLLDPPNPIYDDQRTTIAGMLKELEKLAKRPPSRTPPPVRTKSTAAPPANLAPSPGKK